MAKEHKRQMWTITEKWNIQAKTSRMVWDPIVQVLSIGGLVNL
ncbi:MAG TPA: hypothetical protein VFZ67_02020 [Nitrososphaera sp.]